MYNQEQYVRKAGLFTSHSRHIPVESSFPAIGDNKSKNTPFSNNDYSSVSGDYLCFKVPIERVTLTEYNDVNFI
jgi:hypothetical protein